MSLALIPGAGGVGRAVFEQLRAHDVPVRFMVRRQDERAAELKRLGAEVIIGDLTQPETVAAALQGVTRMFFTMAVSPDHLLAATVVASVAKEYGHLEALVGLSQMTVSQMTATSTDESHQQRLHWLAEQVLNWSGLPVVHVRPTVFLDTPMFTTGRPDQFSTCSASQCSRCWCDSAVLVAVICDTVICDRSTRASSFPYSFATEATTVAASR